MMKGLWFYYAGIYNGLPLDDRSALEQVLADRPRGTAPRDQYVFYPHSSDVPESAGPMIPGRSYTLSAGVDIDSADAQGVIWAAGGVAGGHSLYVKDKKLRYTFNWVGSHFQDVVAETDITPGHHVFTAEFSATGRNTDPEMPGTAGTLTLYVDEQQVGAGPDRHPARVLLHHRRRHLRRPRQRIGRHTGVRRALPVHRRHDREGRDGPQWRALRRPRSPGHRLVHEGLSRRRPSLVVRTRGESAGTTTHGLHLSRLSVSNGVTSRVQSRAGPRRQPASDTSWLDRSPDLSVIAARVRRSTPLWSRRRRQYGAARTRASSCEDRCPRRAHQR